MSRWKQELIALACWLIPSASLGLLLLALFSVGRAASGGAAGRSSVVELGAKQAKKDAPVPLAKTLQSEADNARPQVTRNPVEASPESLETMSTKRMADIVEQYQRIASNKNVRICLIPDQLDARSLGEVYLFKLAGDRKVLFSETGQIESMPSNYSVRISPSVVPREVMEQATLRFESTQLNDPSLVLSKRVVIEMHRSLYEFLSRKGQSDLQSHCDYSATIRRSDSKSFSQFNRGAAGDGLVFAWQVVPQTAALTNGGRN